MNPKSSDALVWAAVIANLLGLVVLSPDGQFFVAAVAALLTIVPAIRARGARRVIAAAVMAGSLALAALAFPEFERSMGQYRQRARERAVGDSIAPSRQAEHGP